MSIIKLKKRPLQGLAILSIAGMLGLTIFSLAVPKASADALIAASVTPSTVVGGSTEEFDIEISTGLAGTSSVNAIIVTESEDFTIDEDTIVCPDGWTLSASSPDSFSCDADADNDIDPMMGGNITFSATAPEVTATTSTMWNLYFQDSDGGEYDGPDVDFTIILDGTGTTTPPGGGNGTTTSATSSPVITLNGDAVATVFMCNGYVELGATAVNSAGASIGATITANTVNINEEGTYTVVYSATDAQGNTATATRTVRVLECGSGGGSSSSGNNSGQVLGAFTQAATGGEMLGLNGFDLFATFSGFPFGFQFGFIPGAGQVLGAFTNSLSGMVLGAFVSDLRVGDRGLEVVELQTRLTLLGYYNGPITGYFGNLTKAAVVRFQSAHGLPSTGFVGPLTRQMLNS